MRPGRIIALVIGCLLVVPAIAALVSGGLLAMAYATQRDDGFFEVGLDELETETSAITAEDIDLQTEPGTPRWVLDALDTDVRLRITSADAEQPIFVGIGRERDVDAYLAGVAHDEISDIDDDLEATYRSRSGTATAEPPADQDFWEASATGTGTQELVWEATSGRWAVAVMNADGSQNVVADADIGIRSDVFLPLAITLLVLGLIGTIAGVALIVFGGRGLAAQPPPSEEVGVAPTPAGPSPLVGAAPTPRHPVSLEATLDPELSNWQWLVKWILAIPHMIVLVFLWVAFSVLTVIAGFAILFTGRYPQGIFDFNVGVLRWSWRVSYYAFSGGLGTDRYPPFSLGHEPDYPATLEIEYPEQLSRGLVLVKWWLLALPHYIIVAILAGAGFSWQSDGGWGAVWGPGGGGLIGILTLIAAVILLFTSTYPRQLFDLIIGMNRWVYRVTAYAALMTDVYPPFRLDQGGSEPSGPPQGAPPGQPSGMAADPVPTATEPVIDVRPTDREPTPLV